MNSDLELAIIQSSHNPSLPVELDADSLSSLISKEFRVLRPEKAHIALMNGTVKITTPYGEAKVINENLLIGVGFAGEYSKQVQFSVLNSHEWQKRSYVGLIVPENCYLEDKRFYPPEICEIESNSWPINLSLRYNQGELVGFHPEMKVIIKKTENIPVLSFPPVSHEEITDLGWNLIARELNLETSPTDFYHNGNKVWGYRALHKESGIELFLEQAKCTCCLTMAINFPYDLTKDKIEELKKQKEFHLSDKPEYYLWENRFIPNRTLGLDRFINYDSNEIALRAKDLIEFLRKILK